MKHKISFIIPVRNERQDVVDATLSGGWPEGLGPKRVESRARVRNVGLLQSTAHYEREILLIDDGSNVPVTCSQPEVILLRNQQPMGVGKSRRYGASIASGDVLVWLDAHMTFAPDWLDQMMAHVDMGALLCSPYWEYDLSHCLCWGAKFKWHDTRDYNNFHAPGFDWDHIVTNPGDGAVDIPLVIGACYMIRRESYRRLGGLSPLFLVVGGDEFDLSSRAWMAGLGVKCVTEANVGHYYRSRFPYPVKFDYIEFNYLSVIRTVFEEPTVKALESYFEPIPAPVQKLLDEADLQGWRSVVQSHRQMSDEEFFSRIAPEMQAFVQHP